VSVNRGGGDSLTLPGDWGGGNLRAGLIRLPVETALRSTAVLSVLLFAVSRRHRFFSRLNLLRLFLGCKGFNAETFIRSRETDATP